MGVNGLLSWDNFCYEVSYSFPVVLYFHADQKQCVSVGLSCLHFGHFVVVVLTFGFFGFSGSFEFFGSFGVLGPFVSFRSFKSVGFRGYSLE